MVKNIHADFSAETFCNILKLFILFKYSNVSDVELNLTLHLKY